MIIYGHQNERQNSNLMTANKFLENVSKFIYSATTITKQNIIHEEIKGS